IHATKFGQLAVRIFAVVQLHAMVSERIADAPKIGNGEAILGKRTWRRAKHLGKIHYRVTCDGEGEFSLTLASAFDTHENECTRIENCSERGDPGLIVVLGAEVSKNRIGEMALHQFGRPAFPIFEEVVESFLAVLVAVAAEEFAGCWRSAGARV